MQNQYSTSMNTFKSMQACTFMSINSLQSVDMHARDLSIKELVIHTTILNSII